jgi:hypothetical protein
VAGTAIRAAAISVVMIFIGTAFSLRPAMCNRRANEGDL